MSLFRNSAPKDPFAEMHLTSEDARKLARTVLEHGEGTEVVSSGTGITRNELIASHLTRQAINQPEGTPFVLLHSEWNLALHAVDKVAKGKMSASVAQASK